MLLRALLPAAVAAIFVAAPAHAAPVSVTYTTVGESVFVVPPGVHSVDVALTGAGGGSYLNRSGGGRGATVTGALPVSPGDRLYAVVGDAGTDFTGGGSWLSNPGGANGGGAGFNGGGGASDIRTAPTGLSGSLNTRRAVAGGGGGAGYIGSGGDAGAPGGDPSGGRAGGLPGTLTAGGAGGIATSGANGTAGSLGVGGDGMAPSYRGGGGGGGLYGGGGGAGMGGCNPCNRTGGGGGGSLLVPAGGTSRLAADGEPAQVTIAYERAQAELSAPALDFASTQPGGLSGSRRVELTNRAASTDLIIDVVSLDSDEFIVGASSCYGAVAPGAKCSIAVRFAPSAPGSHAGTLSIATNAGPSTVAVHGDSPTPGPPAPSVAVAPTATTVAPATQPRTVTSARITCRQKRCSVAFVGDVPKLTRASRVRATLTQGGRVYASTDHVARRGPLRVVLKARRTVKPGGYTLVLRIGATRTTRTAVAS